MASIKYSALVTGMSGKLNGSVLARNRGGNYIRNKTTPLNPQTSAQQNVRSRLSSVSIAWGALTPSQRNGFNELAELHPYTDYWGDQRYLTGKNMFTKLNLNLLAGGENTIQEAPVLDEVPFIEVDGVAAAVGDDIIFTTNVSTVPSGYVLRVFATEPLPATIGFVKNRYRDIGTAVVASGDADITTAYESVFRELVPSDEGKKIHLRAFLLNESTGQVGLATENSADIEGGS